MEQDFEADDPALEIPMVFSERLPRRLLERRLDAGQRHGPQRARDNPIRCAAPSPTTRGAVLGLELGDVLHWPLSAAKARRVRRLGGHAGAVAAALVPGADSAAWAGLVLTGSADACIKVWDLGAVGEGSCVQTLHGHGGTVTTLAAVGTCVVSGSTDRSVRVWRAAPGRKSLIYPWFEPEGIIMTMEGWVHDLSYMCPQTMGDLGVLYAVDNAGAIVKIVPNGQIDPNTKRLGSCLEWSVEGRVSRGSGSPALAFRKLHDRGISSVLHAPDHSFVFTLAYDNHLRVYDSAAGTLIHSWENENGCNFTDMLYDGERLQIIVVDSCGYLAIYCLKKGRMLVSKRLTKHPIVSIYQRMECKDIIVVTTSEIQAWRIDRDVGYNLLRGGHSGPVISLYTCSGGLATPNETDFRLFTASLDNTVRLWDPYDLQCLRVIEETESELSAMTFCETLNLLITGHDDGSIRLWNMDTNTSVDLLQHSNSIMALHMAQVGKQDELLLSSGYDGLLCVWDVRTLRGTRPHLFGRFKTDGAAHINRSGLGPPRCEILCLEYDRVKRVIFTGGNDCTVKVWSFNTYDLLGRHSGHHEPVTCLALDGNFLFSGSEDTSVRIWDAVPAPPHGTSYAACPFSGGTNLKSLCCHTGTVTGLAVSQLSGHLLSCASDGLVLFWDYVAGKVVRKIEHRDELSCMALRPDVSEVLVGTRSNNVLRFPAGEAVRVKGKTGREGHAR